MSLLQDRRSLAGATREHHRCRFHTELHGGQIVVQDEGLSLRSGNGPTTVLSSVSEVGEGVLSWTLKYDGGNTSCMIGLVKEDFGPQLDRHLDVPAWGLCSAHGYDGQGYTRFQLLDGQQFRCIADADLGTFKVWRVVGDGSEGELLLEADDVDCAVSLALCTWNGAQFSIVEDDDSGDFVKRAHSSAPKSGVEKKVAKEPAKSSGPALPLASTAGLAGICALLRSVADDEQLVELATSSVQAVVGLIGTLQPQQMLGDADEFDSLSSLMQSVSTNAAVKCRADSRQQSLLTSAAAGLVALAAAKGSEASLLSAAETLKAISALVDPAVHPVLVELPAVAISLERSVRSAVGIGGESLLPAPHHGQSRVKVMTTTDVAPSVVCFASDGAYLYAACSTTGVYKLETRTDGDDSAVPRVCAHNDNISVSRHAWIGVIGTHVVLRPDSTISRAVVVLDAETLTTVEEMTLSGDPHTPCALMVTPKSVLATVELSKAEAQGVAQHEELQTQGDFEPEPESTEVAAAISGLVGQDLMIRTVLCIDAESGLLLHAEQEEGGRGEKLSQASTSCYPLELHGMVMYGHDADGAEFGCWRRIAVVGSEQNQSKFAAGDTITAKKRPLGFQNFTDNKFFPAKVIAVNEDGTLHVKYDDEHRPDPALPLDMAKAPDITSTAHKEGDNATSKAHLQTLRTFFDLRLPVESKRLVCEYRERFLGDAPASFADVCEEISQRFGADPREQRKTKSAENDEEPCHFLQMAQVKKLVRTDKFDCLLTNDLEVFRRSKDGNLGSPTASWQKLHFDEDTEIVDFKIASDSKLILFVAASGRVWFAGNRPGVDDDDSWVSMPEILPLPTAGGQAPAAKKKGAGPEPVANAPPQGFAFGGGGGGFGAPFGGGGFGGGGAFGAPFGGGGFGGPVPGHPLFGAPAPKDEKKDDKLEFKKVPLGSELPDGWRIASVADVGTNLEKSLSILLEWEIVELKDGKMAGSGCE